MAKKSSIENNKRRQRLVKKFAGRRERLLTVANDDSKGMDERFEARLKLAACRATAPRHAFATAAKCPAGRAPSTAS